MLGSIMSKTYLQSYLTSIYRVLTPYEVPRDLSPSTTRVLSVPNPHQDNVPCAPDSINRGSYMSAHVLLNLLKELGKRDKMQGLPSILSLFCNKFNKFNKTRAGMLDSIYHMTLR